jgi:transcriptional regulator with XRE-family HTH domain
MYWYALTDRAIIRELGNRIKERRLHLNLTQNEVAIKTGLGRTTINAIEHGKSTNLITFVQVLRTMNVLDSLDLFLPKIEFSAKEAFYAAKKKRQRATGTKKRLSEQMSVINQLS